MPKPHLNVLVEVAAAKGVREVGMVQQHEARPVPLVLSRTDHEEGLFIDDSGFTHAVCGVDEHRRDGTHECWESVWSFGGLSVCPYHSAHCVETSGEDIGP